MPLVKLTASEEYFLLNFDETGVERAEADGSMLSETVLRLLGDPESTYSHVFFMSHGWKGDLPAARAQYDAWLAMAAATWPRTGGLNPLLDFRPMVIGLHWPSLPWGDETIETPASRLLGAEITEGQRWARAIAASPTAQASIEAILAEASAPLGYGGLSPVMRSAYQTLANEAGLTGGTVSGRPGTDHPPFDPDAIIDDAKRMHFGPANEGSLLLGGSLGSSARDLLLMPLRQLSFWKMKDRARQVGETGVRDLLLSIQHARDLELHLMGHSFGSIVVSGAVAGPPGDQRQLRPVGSLYLVQGALSLWSYADSIPGAPGTPGYFSRIVREGLVQGPIVTTRSAKDRAVGAIYPLGAWGAGQYVLGGNDFPLYGGAGSFGLQGVNAESWPMLPANEAYRFRRGGIYNLEATGIIRNGDGFSGAHSDIVHPEVAHVVPEAVRVTSEGIALGSGGIHPTSAPAPRLLGGGDPRFDAGVAPPAWSLPDDFRLPAPNAAAPAPKSPDDLLRGDATVLASGTRASEAGVDIRRWVNAALDGHPEGAPLIAARWYTLMLDVDTLARTGSVAAVPLADVAQTPEEIEVEITAQLDSADFETTPATRTIRLPRQGQSTNVARFGISPIHDGPCTLKITLHRVNNFLQQLELKFQVGANVEPEVVVKAEGRPASAAVQIRSRDIGVSLTATGAGYDCIAWGEVSGRATLPFNEAFLGNAVDAFRRDVMKVVNYRDPQNQFVFQAGIDIPEAAQSFALTTMARAGALLFNNIFYGPASGSDSKAIGDFLKNQLGASRARLKLQVVTRGTPIPWACLYLGGVAANDQLSWDKFVGMSHVVEQIPMQPGMNVTESDMPSDKPKLSVSFNVNATIDATMRMTLVGDQDAYWTDAAARRRVVVKRRKTRQELIDALNDPSMDDQILYFYCHADTVGLADAGGPDASYLTLTDAMVTLADLKLEAPMSRIMAGAPLVFINACESAALSPAFYDGFVPYFMAKGARGVVGTECNTPALFARHWASGFFDAFLEGESIGDTFLKLRQTFLNQHRNPLGLLYAVHCDGDTRIAPAPA